MICHYFENIVIIIGALAYANNFILEMLHFRDALEELLIGCIICGGLRGH